MRRWVQWGLGAGGLMSVIGIVKLGHGVYYRNAESTIPLRKQRVIDRYIYNTAPWKQMKPAESSSEKCKTLFKRWNHKMSLLFSVRKAFKIIQWIFKNRQLIYDIFPRINWGSREMLTPLFQESQFSDWTIYTVDDLVDNESNPIKSLQDLIIINIGNTRTPHLGGRHFRETVLEVLLQSDQQETFVQQKLDNLQKLFRNTNLELVRIRDEIRTEKCIAQKSNAQS